MAKIVVLAMAYRGDVHPYVPVASELARRGHEVTFVVPREFHAEFAGEPFTCVHSGSDFGPNELNKHGDWLAKWGMRFGGIRLLELFFGVFTVPHLEAQYAAVHDALEGADVLFAHSTAGIVGSMATEARGLPWISGDLFPMLIPTETAMPLPTIWSFGKLHNRLAWKVARSTRPNRFSFVKDFSDFRRSKGLDDARVGPIDARISPYLNLGMASPHYVPPASDWPSNYHLTGFTHWGNDSGEMPDGLTDFLADGEPPVLITLGTLAAATHPERFEVAVAAADELGLRTVALCSMESAAEQLRSRFDQRRHAAHRFAPLSKVLPHVRGVVHSGSHGTNSMTLAAGLPSVVVPSVFDQVWNAQRQVELGTGVYAKKTKDLRHAVGRLVRDDSLATRAQEMAALLQREDGTAAAADRIEAFLSS